MLFIDNRRWLGQNFREVAEIVKDAVEVDTTGDVIVEPAKSGDLTLQVKGKYIHSKYQPKLESEKLLDKLSIKGTQPVLFFGVGLGYHIEAFMKQNPETGVVLYEPNVEVLIAFLKRLNLTKFAKGKIIDIIVGTDDKLVKDSIKKNHQKTRYQLQLFTLPVIAVLYVDMHNSILEILKESKKERRDKLATDAAYQKRWVTNSIKNAPTVLRTPNMLRDIDKSHFKDKPAIIVAAGPSLNREFETLRKIKDEGRAYIFAVGSAINALVNHDIYPDATLTYDPKSRNQRVIEIIKQHSITEIPLIFGSSVGYETLHHYPGEMYHMITSQDTVINQLTNTQIPYVQDAPSVAVLGYQLLYDLGVSPIILVGQNLSYVNGYRHARGIDYGTNGKVDDENLKNIVYTLDVEGKAIETEDSYNSMRQHLELYIKIGRPTINTTVGGAHIQGTTFEYLENLLTTVLVNEGIVEDWSTMENSYNRKVVKGQLLQLTEEYKYQQCLIKDGFAQLQKIYDLIIVKNYYYIENEYGKLDKIISCMQNNRFYLSFVEPMIRIQYEALRQTIEDLRYITNQQDKGTKVIPLFNEYFCVVRDYMEYAKELFDEMKEKVEIEER